MGHYSSESHIGPCELFNEPCIIDPATNIAMTFQTGEKERVINCLKLFGRGSEYKLCRMEYVSQDRQKKEYNVLGIHHAPVGPHLYRYSAKLYF